MARKEARIFTSIWDDEDFVALTQPDQWLYFALLSQRDLSMCGVLPDTPQRWSRLAQGTPPEAIVASRERLVEGRFVIRDPDTAELLLRSLVRQDKVLESANLTVSMARAFESVHSKTIRQEIVKELWRVFPQGVLEGLAERFTKPLAEPPKKGLPKPLPKPFLERLPQGFKYAVHRPCTNITPSPHHPITPSLADVDPTTNNLVRFSTGVGGGR